MFKLDHVKPLKKKKVIVVRWAYNPNNLRNKAGGPGV